MKFLALAEGQAAAQEGAQSAAGFGWTGTIIYFGVLILIFYFLFIRPNKKRQRQMQNMLDSMRKGDEIITIGGIMGKVFAIRHDYVIITTSADETKMKFEKTAIARIVTVHDDIEEVVESDKSSKKNK